MANPRDIISSILGGGLLANKAARDVLQELWGSGFTVVARPQRDPLHVPDDIIPSDTAYQWCSKRVLGEEKDGDYQKMLAAGWTPVPASRHEGYFGPAGYEGDIESGGLILMERPKKAVEDAHFQNAVAAKKLVTDWAERTGANGFIGGVRSWVGPLDSEPPDNESSVVVGDKDSPFQNIITARIQRQEPPVAEEEDKLPISHSIWNWRLWSTKQKGKSNGLD